LLPLIVITAAIVGLNAQASSTFPIEELTIAQLHAAFARRQVTCRAVVAAYLRRIALYDKRGASLNSVVLVNQEALNVADDLDRQYNRRGLVGPMHCVPTIVKDNFAMVEMPTTAGSLSLKGMMTGKDAFVVKMLRDGGAVMIARSNMAEFAFSPVETVSSILPGYTRNPYDMTRVTAGSSGGSAAAIAANFGLIALATDTGNSIRGPAAHQALVGLRSTMGLVSRAGIVPLNLASDIAGAVTRTVADTAAVLQVIARRDPDDPATAASHSHLPVDYTSALDPNGLRGMRLGVLVQAYRSPTLDDEVATLFGRAISDLRRLGAEVVDPVVIENLDAIRGRRTGTCNQFKHDLNNYLAGLGERAPVTTLERIIKTGQFHPSIQSRLEIAEATGDVPGESAGCRSRDDVRRELRAALLSVLDDQRLDAVIYPTWSNPPRLIGDLNSPDGDNNQLFAPSTGFPALTVPMGFTRGDTLPAGLQFLGRPWDEVKLIRLAYAYERRTGHRRAPRLD
jgi:amidase